MTWETFHGRMRKSPDEPTVTLSSQGTISINAAVVRKVLGDARFAVLMFDREKTLMGIKFVKEGNHDVYPVRVTDNNSHGQISGVAFMKEYNIYPEKTQKFEAKFDDHSKILIVDVSDLKGGKKKGTGGNK